MKIVIHVYSIFRLSYEMSFGEENIDFVELKPDLQNVQIKTEAVDYISNESVSVKQEISEIVIPKCL